MPDPVSGSLALWGAFWPCWGAVPRGGSGQDPDGAQKPRLRAAVLRAAGKSDQGLSKQHSPHLGICKWDSPKHDAESVSEVSFGCEPRKGWVGAESREEGRDKAAHFTRVSPWFENENRKRSPWRKVLTADPEASAIAQLVSARGSPEHPLVKLNGIRK